MEWRNHVQTVALCFCLVCLPGCAGIEPTPERIKATMEEFGRSERQWTGVAVAKDGRVFVNFPRWSEDVPFSVGELLRSGEVKPFPDEEWNGWAPGMDSSKHFVCAQSVVVDGEGFLWIVDPANPGFKGVVAGGPKLVKVDLGSSRVVRSYLFDDLVAPPHSYLNDVRIDAARGYAYLTDSGAGAIVVLELASGKTWRRLAVHPSTRSENVILRIGGKAWLPDGKVPRVHADGLALDPPGEYLYFQALTGKTLYRIQTQWLRDLSLSEEELGARVQRLGVTGAADGMEFGRDGRLYLTGLEESAIKLYDPVAGALVLVQSDLLAWPDSIAAGPDGFLYVTTSQIHLGSRRMEPYRIFKVRPQHPGDLEGFYTR